VHVYNKQLNPTNEAIGLAVTMNPALPFLSPVWQTSQELTLTATLSDRLDMIVGGLYLHHHTPVEYDLGIPSFGFPNDDSLAARLTQDLTSEAGYTQWRYRVTDTIRLTAGVRYTRDAKDLYDRSTFNGVPTPANASGSWSGTTPRVTVDYEPTRNLTAYATASEGYKAGGFANNPGGPSAVEEFGPEHVRNYEVGAKTKWFDGRLASTVAAFYMRYTDLQQGLFGVAANGIFESVVNASSVPVRGVEWDLSALVTDRLRLATSGTLLNAKYQDLFSADPFYPALGLRNLSGNQLIHAPKAQLNVSGDYTVPLSNGWQGVLRASIAWQSRVYFDIFNHSTVSQGDYGVGNLSGSLESKDGKWQVSTFVTNVTNKFYWSLIQTGDVITNYTVGAPGLPRMVGGSVAYHF
jgi:iron complex outermembrane receptor protein